MKPFLVLSLLSAFFTLASHAVPTNLSPSTTEEKPVVLLTEAQRSYLYDQDHVSRDKNVGSAPSYSGGSAVALSWSGASGSVTVSVKRLADSKVVHTETTSASSLKVYNLEIGAGYEWTVADSSGKSAPATFYTSPDAPRLLKAGSMKVLRDIGGWKGLGGCKVRQNELFRGGPASGIDNAAKTFFHDVVGLKTELDLRGQSSDKLTVDGVAYVPLSRDAQYRVLMTTVNGRSGMSEEKWQNLITTFQYIFDKSKRPLYFHCSVGRDRTGVTAALALALLGVDMEDIWRDYQATPQSAPFIDDDKYFQGYLHDMATVMSGHGTFQEQVEAYFIEKLGFSRDQIETFRKEMLIGYGVPAHDGNTPTNLSPSTTAANPISLLTDEQRDYLYGKTVEQRRAAAADANDKYDTLFCYGSPVELKWEGVTGPCNVSVKRLADGKVVWTATVDGTSATVENLELGAGYEWSVTSGASGPTASARFWTSDLPPRLVKSGRMKMLRDLGGWTGLQGRKIRQNLIFRGAAADVPPDSSNGVAGEYLLSDDADRAFFYDVVGLGNEVDFRNSNEKFTSYKFDLTGDHVKYNSISIDNNTLPTSGKLADAVRFLTDPAKMPCYFHCKSGRDRTGTCAAVLLAVLGVSRDDILRDYQATSDKDNLERSDYNGGFLNFLDVKLAKYSDANLSLAENARAYLLDCGLTSENVESFRATMLEGYVEEPQKHIDDDLPNLFSVSPYVQHPDTNAMTVVFFTTANVKATVKCWRADGRGGTNELLTACVDVSGKLGKNALGNSDTLTYTKQYKHRVRFENLRTLTDYRYEVKPEGGAAYRNIFRTLPGKDTPVRFIGYCDSETTPGGSATSWSNNGGKSSYFVGLTEGFASNIVHMVSRKPDLITISGDIAAKGGYQKNWDEFWRQNAGANGKGYNDPAGSIPILAAIGNHDLKDGSSTIDAKGGGESALEKYLTYFEYNPNGVKYEFSDGTTTKETRDMSQLFHREDLGPVTLIFLDTNKGANGKSKDSTQDYSDRPAMRSPDFHPGSLQYTWLTNNLADAQRNSKFTFVLNHHCPYSVGQHNRPSDGGGYDGYDTGSGCDGESAQAVRCLTDTMIRYGVDAWLCGHDEIQEHSQLTGTEILPDGTTREHTINVYDLGSGGDGLRGTKYVDNPYEKFRAFADSGERWENGILVEGGCHYGFMEVDVTTNRLGKWTCSLTPCYDFIYKNSSGKAAGFELRRYKDRIIIDEETDEIVYQEWKGDRELPADYVEYVRPTPSYNRRIWTEEPHFVVATKTVLAAGGATETQYTGFETTKGLWYAWGKDGVAVTEWSKGDGTPCRLEKPDGEWELLVSDEEI